MQPVVAVKTENFKIKLYLDESDINPYDDWEMFGTLYCFHKYKHIGESDHPFYNIEDFMFNLADFDPDDIEDFDYENFDEREFDKLQASALDRACEENIVFAFQVIDNWYTELRGEIMRPFDGSCDIDGVMVATAEDCQKETWNIALPEGRERAENLICGEIATINKYFARDVYGVEILEQCDKCKGYTVYEHTVWGYYGLEDTIAYALSELGEAEVSRKEFEY